MFNLGRNILVWVLRHLLALVLILIILIVGRYALAPAVEWYRGQAEASRSVAAQQATQKEARDDFDAWAERRRAEAGAQAAGLTSMPEAALRARRAAIGPAIAHQQQARLGGAQLALAAAGGEGGRVLGHYRAGAEIALLERERRTIDALLELRSAGAGGPDPQARRRAAVQQVRVSYARWRSAHARVEALNRRPMAEARNFLCRTARPDVGCDNYRAMVAARQERDSALADNRAAHRTIVAIDRATAALGAAQAQSEATSAIFAAQRQAIDARAAELERAAGQNWILWIRQPILEVLPTALLILAGVIFGPLLVKALLYFAIAPIAGRRPPIRLVPAETGEVAIDGPPSAVSQRVPLEPGQELLVVPEAVQSTPHEAAKATQWLLSWAMPLSSLASGMVALVRIRTRRPDFVLVSATEDPLAEVALVRIAAGSAMVLRPRALRGIVQPLGHATRITRHWRLASLSGWLTLQFRYLVFHGPATLIVQGRRGVRLEQAGPGRGINQAATIGFSAGLAYSVRRSEAFGPYLMGRQELFNDSFESVDGWYLYEEMPREAGEGGLWGRGIQGLGDAALKVFGI